MEEGNGGQVARATVIDVPMKAQRSLATVTAEILSYQEAARRMVITYSIEIGRRLIEAKGMVDHGDWGRYLREELGFSQSTANNHMRLFEAYAAGQMTLTGAAVNNQAFADLTYTQALALLALPSEEEREAFVETHDVAAMSTRELKEELRRRGEKPEEDAQKALEEMKRLREEDVFRMKLISEQADKSNSAWAAVKKSEEAALKAAAEAEDKFQAADRKAQEAANRVSELQTELEKARRAKDKAKRELAKAKENKEAPPELLEQLRKEAEAAAEARHKADSEELAAAKAQCVKAETDVDAARQEAARARQEAETAAKSLAALQKELSVASPKVAVFRDRFASLQADLGALITSIEELPEDKQAGARNGIRTILQNALNMVQEPEEVQA